MVLIVAIDLVIQQEVEVEEKKNRQGPFDYTKENSIPTYLHTHINFCKIYMCKYVSI